MQRATPIPKKRTGVFFKRIQPEKDEFYLALKKIIPHLPNPVYAFNAQFEDKFLKSKLSIDLDLLDIAKPSYDKAHKNGLKWPRLDELIKIPKEYYGKKQSSAREIPQIWNSFENKNDKRLLWLIVQHNKEDLLQMLFLLLHTDAKKMEIV